MHKDTEHQSPNKQSQTPDSDCTIEDLLYSFIAHLCSCKALQRDDGGVSSISQQHPTSLQVSSQSRPVQRRLTQSVNSIHL